MKLAQRRCYEVIDLDQDPPVKYTAVKCSTALAELEGLDRLQKETLHQAREEERERVLGEMIEKLKTAIKPSNDHCPQCRSIVDGWNLAIESVWLRLEKDQSLTKTKEER